MHFTFNDIVSLHVNRLCTLRWKFLSKRISQEAYDAAVMAERSAWYDICLGLEDRGYTEKPLDELTPQERETYDTKDGFPLIGLLIYRGVTVPMYDDDYGQQVFAVWNDHEFSGGAYNLDYCNVFVTELDHALDCAEIEAYEREYLSNGE